jgi:hypothetical protein
MMHALTGGLTQYGAGTITSSPGPHVAATACAAVGLRASAASAILLANPTRPFDDGLLGREGGRACAMLCLAPLDTTMFSGA